MGFWKWINGVREARRRVLDEDALKHLHACEWAGGTATRESLSGALALSPRQTVRLCQRLESRGSIRSVSGGLRLTPEGEKIALQVIRAHRLWERYLADEARMPLSRLHAEADRREHRRPPGRLQELDASMGYPQRDPHGDPIPSPTGEIERIEGRPLTEWSVDEVATIVHLEDEPETVFSQIVALGLQVGQTIRVLESNPDRIVFASDHETHVLAPVIAANVFVAPTERRAPSVAAARLSSLEDGGSATVARLDESLQGYTRRRLLDLGLTPGARIEAAYSSFLGDPMAYRVRGALIALRKNQADQVWITTNDPDAASSGHVQSVVTHG